MKIYNKRAIARISSRRFSSVVDANPSKDKGPAVKFVPRARIDVIVSKLSEIQKVESRVKSILTQRKLVASKIDLGRIEILLDKRLAENSSLLGYVTKASTPPKASTPKTASAVLVVDVLGVVQARDIT